MSVKLSVEEIAEMNKVDQLDFSKNDKNLDDSGMAISPRLY